MAYGGENQIVLAGWGGAAGRPDEPFGSKLNRILVQRFQIDASEQMAPADTTVETANTKKLTLGAALIMPGDRLHVHGWGAVTASNAAAEITTRLRLGGLTGVELAVIAGYDAVDADHHEWDAWLWFEAVGAATPTTPTSKFHSRGRGWRTGGSDERTVVKDNQTLSTLAALDIVATQDWSTNNAGNRFKLYELSAELYRTRQTWG